MWGITARRGQNQQKELPGFPGAVLFTTNCIQNPKDYGGKVFTSGIVGWPGLVHIKNRDFAPLILKALELPGFAEDAPGKEVTVGFGRKTLLDAAPAVLDAVKSGAVRHIFLVGGCDGAKPGRNYYTEFVEKTPQDTLILTLACGKFRFFDKDLGKIGRSRAFWTWGSATTLFRRQGGRCAGRRAQVRRQRSAALAGAVVVRAEGRGYPADPARPRREEHPPRTEASRPSCPPTSSICWSKTGASSPFPPLTRI